MLPREYERARVCVCVFAYIWNEEMEILQLMHDYTIKVHVYNMDFSLSSSGRK